MDSNSPNSTKSLKTAYLIWLVVGILGIHRFYLGKKRSGAILLILTLIWGLSYLFSAQEAVGILALVESMSPLQDWLVQIGQIGKWISALIFLPILLFPVLWWFTDLFRIPRMFKTLK